MSTSEWKLVFTKFSLFAVMCLIFVNGTIRQFGGSPAYLSPFWLNSKLSAISHLVGHLKNHYGGSCERNLKPMLVASAKKHRVPVDFVLSVAKTESGTRAHTISHAGAMGVLQLMPGTAALLGVDDPYDAEQNIDGGVRYMRMLWTRYGGDRRRVAAAYNAGPGNIPRAGNYAMPDETRTYVKRVVDSR